MGISSKQVSLVHIAKDRLGLDEETYRDALRYVAGVGRSTELDQVGFDFLMEHFANLGFVSDWRARNLGSRPGMATFK